MGGTTIKPHIWTDANGPVQVQFLDGISVAHRRARKGKAPTNQISTPSIATRCTLDRAAEQQLVSTVVGRIF